MKKKIFKSILLISSLFILLLCNLQAQDKEVALEVSLENFRADYVAGTSIFDIYLTRTTDIWHLWENATFQMVLSLEDFTEINYQDFDVEILFDGSEVVTSYTGEPYFKINAKMLEDRLILMILGPNNYANAKHFDMMSKLKLCGIKIIAKNPANPNLPMNINWKTPFDYYQSTAFVYLEGINKTPEYVVEPKDKDNVEISWITSFKAPIEPKPLTIIDFFEVEYLGNLNAVCRYGTMSEANNKGFVIKRGIYNELIEDWESLPDDIFTTTVGDYRIPEFYERMKGQMFSYSGKKYDPIPDKIEKRTVNYVYRLYSDEEGKDELTKLATRNLITPNAVITQATAYPNPCPGETKIDYVVEDDVYLTCEVINSLGGRIKILSDNINGKLENTFVRSGKYTVDFAAPELASQGAYDVIFTAHPVNDKSVEISGATVKVQLIRGYYTE
jgi:hypothetical protein